MTRPRRAARLTLHSAMLVALAAISGGGGSVAAQSAPGRVDLAGTVTLQGSGPGAFPVHIPQPATITLFPYSGQPHDVTVQGSGRVVGFLLHQDGGWNAIIASYERYGFCATPGCPPSTPSVDGGFYDPHAGGVGQSRTLPPGDYHLYFFADAAPAVVTLHFHGLPGSLLLRPSGPAPVEVLTAPTTVALPAAAAGPMDYGAGVTRSVSAGAATGIVMWADSPLPSEVTRHGTCAYQGGPPPHYPAYQYPCEGSVCCESFVGGSFQLSQHGGVLGLTGEYRSFLEDGVLEAPGTWGVGGSIQSTAPVTDAHVVEVWVRFDDPTTSSGGPALPVARRPPVMPMPANGATETLSLPRTAPADGGGPAAALAAIVSFMVTRWRRHLPTARLMGQLP